MKRLFAFIIVVCIITSALPIIASAEKSYGDFESTAEVLRVAMVERKTEVTVYYKTKSLPTDDDLSKLFKAATAENGSPTSGDYLYYHLNRYSADGGYRRQGGYYYCDVTFMFTYYTTAAQEAELTKAVDKLIASFGFTEDTSDYEKIETIYSYICNNVDYDHANLYDDSYVLKYSAYAALINKSAVCQGYANLFYRLMHEVGIGCRMITGKSSGQNHAWNIVELDGVFYYVDSTWDAGLDEYMYFLKCADHFDDHLSNSDYTQADFVSAYPIADECYTKAPELSECEKHGHDMGDWYETKGATVDEGGEERRDCSRCAYYEVRSTPPANPVPNAVLGDINGNNELDKYDYIAVKRAYMATLILTEEQQKLADVNGINGVDIYDYILIKRHVMGTFVILQPQAA